MRTIIAALLVAAAPAPAQEAAFLPKAKLIKPIALGSVYWGKDNHFRLKWKSPSQGRFLWADLDVDSGLVWTAVERPPDKVLMTEFDEHGEPVKSLELLARFDRFKLLPRGKKKAPLFVGRNSFQLIVYDPTGGKVELSVPKTSASGFEVVPKARRRKPMIVASYTYGGAGLRAFRPDGKLLWELEELERADRVRLERMDGKDVLVATGGLGKATVVSLRGKVLERIRNDGNADRVMLDSSKKESWLYALDSGAGSWKEKLTVKRTVERRFKKDRWRLVSSAELGRIDVTAYVLGDFEGKGRMPVLGTANGWVLLLDRAGRVVSESRFRHKITGLEAHDFDGDGKEELVVMAEGYSGNVFVFTRSGS